jgi:AcrR family transcriptional regulator
VEKSVKVGRAYNSERRQSQARQTRRQVLSAAKRLFVEVGYGATTVQQIADEAGVSVQTVYATFGNKRQVLEEALDLSIAGDDEAVVVNDRDWMREVFTDPDPRRRLAAYAAAVRRIHAGAADMFAVIRAAAAADSDLQAFADMTDQRRRVGAASVIAGLVGIGALRSDLDEPGAVDILWTLNSPETFQLLVRRSGWSPERFELWLAATMQSQLLASPG